MDYDEYLARILDANILDYEKGKDQTLDLFLWLGQIGDRIFNRDQRTQDEWNKDFFAMKQSDYKRGDNWWLDVVLDWQYYQLKYRHKW